MVAPSCPATQPATGVLRPVQTPNSGRDSSRVAGVQVEPTGQISERLIAIEPITGVVLPSPLNAPILFPPSAGSLKYTSSAVASICAFSIGLQVDPPQVPPSAVET